MQKFWLISNHGAGSTDFDKQAAVIERFADHGATQVGATNFPHEALPTAKMLDAAGADTAVLFAGDGTINAAIGALEVWAGAILILPGGTMNLLAKRLHGDADPLTIVDRAIRCAPTVALHRVEVGEARAYVGLILGPAAAWAHAREAARAGRSRAVLRAIAHAWRRTLGKGIRIAGVPGLTHRVQAVFVVAEAGGLRVASIDARDWRAIASLGWQWLNGDWVAAAAAREVRTQAFRVAERRPVLGLFDGEPQMVAVGTAMRAGQTGDHFIQTRDG